MADLNIGNSAANVKVTLNQNGDVHFRNGILDFDASSLPQFSGTPLYLVGIESFSNGGTLKWAEKASVSVGSADTATKLQTARSIWGQPFNGTANISGNMTGVGNINTAAAPAGTVYMSNWFRSTGSTGWYNESYGGGWYMTDSTYIRNYAGKTVRLDNLCLGADNNSYRLYVNGTSYFNGNTTHNGIDYFANGTTYYINNYADANLRRGMFAGTSNADTAASNFYNSGAIEIRESGRVGSGQSSFNYAPRIGFHWSGRIAATLSFHNDGIFYLRKQNGSDRATLDANLNGNAATATKATQDGDGNVITSYYLPKTTYEYNKELAFGSSGKLCIGKFPMYDSNITVTISSTTNTTYHGTLVIATQNINTSGGGSKSLIVYGDPSGSLSSSIFVHYGTGSNVFSVYIDCPSWSKVLLHIQCVALAGTPKDIATSISSIPSDATLRPSNALITATNTWAISTSGNAATATKLATARTIRTNLASTSAASFDGSANITPGVTGTLPIANGGTGATTASTARNNLGAQSKVLYGPSAPSDSTGSNGDMYVALESGDFKKDIVNLIYPVGSIYISMNSTNPSTLFGGTWQAFGQGRVLIGAGTGNDGSTSLSFTAGNSGGEYKHTLSVSEMPSHTHTQNAHTHTVGAHSHGLNSHTHSYTKATGVAGHTLTVSEIPAHSHLQYVTANSGGGGIRNDYNSDAHGLPYSQGINTGNTGGGGSHNHGLNTSSANTGAASGSTANSSAFNSGSTTATNKNTGGGSSHNNIQPYIVVYMWKRTA